MRGEQKGVAVDGQALYRFQIADNGIGNDTCDDTDAHNKHNGTECRSVGSHGVCHLFKSQSVCGHLCSHKFVSNGTYNRKTEPRPWNTDNRRKCEKADYDRN